MDSLPSQFSSLPHPHAQMPLVAKGSGRFSGSEQDMTHLPAIALDKRPRSAPISGYSIKHISFSDNGRDNIANFLGLINERLSLMPAIAAAKTILDKPVYDPEREQKVLANAEQKAEAIGLDPELARRFVQAQMEAAKALQTIAPAKIAMTEEEARTKLDSLRKRISNLTVQLLEALKDIDEHLHSVPFKNNVTAMVTNQPPEQPLSHRQLQQILLNALYPRQ